MFNILKRKKRVKLIIFLLVFWGLNFVVSSQVVFAKVGINYSSVTVIVGESIQLNLKGEKGKIVWKTNKNNIVKVSSNGKVIAKQKGNVIVTATTNKKVYKCKINVEDPKINVTYKNLNVGESFKLKIKGCSHQINWKTKNANIVEVDNGTIMAKAVGTTEIIASVHKQKFISYITVNDTYISMDYDIKKLGVGCEEKLLVKKNGKETINATDISWTSSNEKVASVDNMGNIKTYSVGTTVIIARWKIYRAQCKINVKDDKTISFDKTNLILNPEDKQQMIILFENYEDGDDKTIYWSSSETAVATVNKDGMVTAKNPGKAEIKAVCNGNTATCEITVKDRKIIMSSESETISVGETVKLMVNYEGFSKIEDKNLIWTTAESSVATVNNGVVTGVGTGSTIINVKYGNYSDTCVIWVIE